MYDRVGVYGDDHSRSYTYIIKNVYSDPGEVFDTILDDEKVMDRASSVTESYDDFIKEAHSYDNGTMWELARDGHISGTIERRELKRKLYRAVANVNILEGIRFYVSFACSFAALARINLWRSQFKILSLIARDESFNTGYHAKYPQGNGKKETTQK